MGDTPAVLEEYMQYVTRCDDLKVLLRSRAAKGELAKMNSSGESVCL